MASSSRANPQPKPSFFKVLLEDFSTKLEIPPQARIEAFETIPKELTLRTQMGTWTVKVKKTRTEDDDECSLLFHGQGWVDLVKRNGFTKGDFIVFSPMDDAHFHVLSFGKTCCLSKPMAENRNPPRNHTRGSGRGKAPSEGIDPTLKKCDGKMAGKRNPPRNGGSGLEIVPSSCVDPKLKKSNKKTTGKQNPPKNHTSGSGLEIVPSSSVDPALQISNRKTTGKRSPPRNHTSGTGLEIVPISPYEVTLKRFNLFGLFVPAEFVEETGMRRRKAVVVEDSEGREWPVKVSAERGREIFLGDGWGDFVKGNGIQVGMSCRIQSVVNQCLVDDEDEDDDAVLVLQVRVI